MKKSKKLIAVLSSLTMAVTSAWGMIQYETMDVQAATSVKAFPGAVGGGSYATGGRGGEVVHVTNLNDSGSGSFREAVSQSGRIVVFDVGGTIELKSDVVVQSNITIAGQTAPGGSGITLKNYKLGLGGSNIICRFISSRPGERGTSQDYDAWGGSGGSNSIIDHCSIGWANDEQWGLYSKNDNYTVQYSVIGPSNSFSYHSKGIHGFGVMFGRSNVTWDHNLIVHNVSRNVRGKVPGTGASDFTNNVIYNWGSQTTYGTLGHMNYVGNTLKKGASTIDGNHYISVADSGTSPENYSIYLTGNRFLNKDGTQYSNLTENNWAGIRYKNDTKNESNTRSDSHFPIMVNGVDVSTALTAEDADVAYEHVLSYAGNGVSTDARTAIDKQVAYETRTGTGTLTGGRPLSEASSSQLESIEKYSIQCGVQYEYPKANYEKIVDSDGDGMEDDWELERGLNPDDAGDANGDYCRQGYTNIEYYLNDLTVDAFPKGVVTKSPTTTTIVEEPVDIFAISIKSAGESATVNGRAKTIIFNGNNDAGNGVELINPFVGRDTSKGATVSFWLKPTGNISAKDYNYISILSFIDGDNSQLLKYDLGGTRQYASADAKLNYWETTHSMTAGKEYYITCVMDQNGLEMYCNGVKVGYSGYANLEESIGRTNVLTLISAAGSRMFAGGTTCVPDSMLALSTHRLPEGTTIRNVVGSIGTLSSRQARTLYEKAVAGEDAAATPLPNESAKPETSALPRESTEPEPSTLPRESTEPEPSTLPSESTEPEPSALPSESAEPEMSELPSESTEPNAGVLPQESEKSGVFDSEMPQESEKIEDLDSETPKESEITGVLSSESPSVPENSPEGEASQVPSSAQPDYVLGDVNRDGMVTLVDARMILRYALLLDEAKDEIFVIADMDENDVLSLDDARKALRRALLLE